MASLKLIRNRIVVLGDQLDLKSHALQKLDPKTDEVWMAEVVEESTHVSSHRARSVLFLSAMRHFRDELRDQGISVRYLELGSDSKIKTFNDALVSTQKNFPAEKWILTEPGEHRVLQEFLSFSRSQDVSLEIVPDESFLVSRQEFAEYAKGRSGLRMEFFYRWMRARTGILMKNGKPNGDRWNFDQSNRKAFGKKGPSQKIEHLRFAPDSITKEVIKSVDSLLSKNPGNTENFDWPVTRNQALKALRYFIQHHLPQFGTYQDAMWSGEAFLHHSLLSAAMNLKLLRPLEVIEAAEKAYQEGEAPLESVEGFIRQILGWREYVRGIYNLMMPEYLERNALGAEGELPEFFWSGETSMNCLREAITQTLDYGYAHHIQRLMVTGLYCLLLGVDPKKVHEWYLAVYVDAVEWVELPNTLGMSQFADGGVMASKPYIASGKYINRMSNYCQSCAFNPDLAVGENACPFTTLFWDFVDRHRKLLARNPRLGAQVKNWERLSADTQKQIKRRAQAVRAGKFERETR